MGDTDVKTLNHYCNLDTFLNIIKSKTIRLSDINKSNDFLETKALLKIIKDEAVKLHEANPIKYEGMLIYGMDNIDAVNYMIGLEIDKILKQKDMLIYAACFSEKPDLLSQWRGYADNGSGVSIGFDKNCIQNIAGKSELLELRKIEYVSDYHNLTNNIVSKYGFDLVNNIIETLSSHRTKELLFNPYCSGLFSMLTQRSLLSDSIFFKHYSFEEEQEWRLALTDELFKDDDNWNNLYNWQNITISSDPIYNLFPKGMQFRSAGNNIISFLDLCFEPFIEDIFNSIVIGPNCKMDEDDLNQLLCYFGYNAQEIDISFSESTYSDKNYSMKV